MKEPNLMPFQDQAFNGDTFIQQEFLTLKEKYQITTVVETGTCLGTTTLWFSDNFGFVHTTEVNEKYLDIAKAKYHDHIGKNLGKNVRFYLGDSPQILSTELTKLSNRTIYFLDAHGFGNDRNPCPLLAELKAIANAGLRPIIAIHDFKVPGSSLGFDSYNNQPFTLDWIKPALAAIYNDADTPDVCEYEYYYNSDDTAAGARRGIIYIIPA